MCKNLNKQANISPKAGLKNKKVNTNSQNKIINTNYIYFLVIDYCSKLQHEAGIIGLFVLLDNQLQQVKLLQNLMEQYFSRMQVLAKNTELPSRIRFLLRDVIELRNDKWVPRKASNTEGPMPMNQVTDFTCFLSNI